MNVYKKYLDTYYIKKENLLNGIFEELLSEDNGGFDETLFVSVGDNYYLNPNDSPLVQSKTLKMKELNDQHDISISNLIGGVANRFEVASWTKQEAQARAYIASNLTVVPLLSGLIISRGRGETLLELSNKIVAAANAYEIGYSSILGNLQAKGRLVVAAKTYMDVQNVLW